MKASHSECDHSAGICSVNVGARLTQAEWVKINKVAADRREALASFDIDYK